MNVPILERFKDVGYAAVVHNITSLAISVVSDFLTILQYENADTLTGEINEDFEFAVKMIRDVTLLRDAINPDAILSPGQQTLLCHYLQNCSETPPMGLGEYIDIMKVVDFVHGCNNK